MPENQRQPDARETPETPRPPEEHERAPTVDTVEALHELAQQTTQRMDDDAASARAVNDVFLETLDAAGMEPQARGELAAAQNADITALGDTARADINRETGLEQKSVSLWERARQWREQNTQRIDAVKAKKEDGRLTREYGKGTVNAKFSLCAQNPSSCAQTYLERRQATGRSTPSPEQMSRVLLALSEKSPLEDGRDIVLLEEMTQEIAYADYQRRKEAGEVTLGAQGIAADMLLELDLENAAELEVETFEQGLEAVRTELREYVEKGYLNEKEATLILETVSKFGNAMLAAFEGKRFPGGETMTAQSLAGRAYEGMRDNARKIAYQTKMDKRVFSGSDHGTRHICEGCTHFSEQMMDSLKGLEGVDFEPQDEVLIRQIIIDHDIGYTTDAAQAKGGFEASKDHPCAGCDFVEANKDSYVLQYGEEGYDIIRDVVLNHSYAQSEYAGTRPEAAQDEITYNRDLVRSVVSTVDAMGVTSETKAMDMFRHPETIDILQDVKLYSETHGGKVDDAALAQFKWDMGALVEQWLAEIPPRISQERAKGYRSAIENQFNPVTVEITLGQFTGVVKEMKMVRRPDGSIAPEIRMDVSRLAALIGDTFGEKEALKGFTKAMEDFGLTKDRLQHMAGLVRQLRGETYPQRRAALQKQLTYESDRATFIVGESETTGLPDEREEELHAIFERFAQFERETVRSELRHSFEALREVAPDERTPEMVMALSNELRALFELDDAQTRHMDSLIDRLASQMQDNETLSAVQTEVSQFKSETEKTRLRKYEEAVNAVKQPLAA